MDRYWQALKVQNEGGTCADCGADSGHFGHCPLINRNTAEAHSKTLSEGDSILLHGLGVRY
jgi:hypothetical protein